MKVTVSAINPYGDRVEVHTQHESIAIAKHYLVNDCKCLAHTIAVNHHEYAHALINEKLEGVRDALTQEREKLAQVPPGLDRMERAKWMIANLYQS